MWAILYFFILVLINLQQTVHFNTEEEKQKQRSTTVGKKRRKLPDRSDFSQPTQNPAGTIFKPPPSDPDQRLELFTGQEDPKDDVHGGVHGELIKLELRPGGQTGICSKGD